MTTMNDLYQDESNHEACTQCGMCISCGDCLCKFKDTRLFIINGYPASGKDTFAMMLIEEILSYGLFGSIVSSVYNVKWAAEMLGWDKKKDEKGRNALSALKDFSTQWWDGPFNTMCENANYCGSSEAIVFMVREPEEIARFVAKYPNTLTIFIQRDSCEKASNHADTNVENYSYDFYVENNDSLEELRDSAKFIAHQIYG